VVRTERLHTRPHLDRLFGVDGGHGDYFEYSSVAWRLDWETRSADWEHVHSSLEKGVVCVDTTAAWALWTMVVWRPTCITSCIAK